MKVVGKQRTGLPLLMAVVLIVLFCCTSTAMAQRFIPTRGDDGKQAWVTSRDNLVPRHEPADGWWPQEEHYKELRKNCALEGTMNCKGVAYLGAEITSPTGESALSNAVFQGDALSTWMHPTVDSNPQYLTVTDELVRQTQEQLGDPNLVNTFRLNGERRPVVQYDRPAEYWQIFSIDLRLENLSEHDDTVDAIGISSKDFFIANWDLAKPLPMLRSHEYVALTISFRPRPLAQQKATQHLSVHELQDATEEDVENRNAVVVIRMRSGKLFGFDVSGKVKTLAQEQSIVNPPGHDRDQRSPLFFRGMPLRAQQQFSVSVVETASLLMRATEPDRVAWTVSGCTGISVRPPVEPSMQADSLEHSRGATMRPWFFAGNDVHSVLELGYAIWDPEEVKHICEQGYLMITLDRSLRTFLIDIEVDHRGDRPGNHGMVGRVGVGYTSTLNFGVVGRGREYFHIMGTSVTNTSPYERLLVGTAVKAWATRHLRVPSDTDIERESLRYLCEESHTVEVVGGAVRVPQTNADSVANVYINYDPVEHRQHLVTKYGEAVTDRYLLTYLPHTLTCEVRLLFDDGSLLALPLMGRLQGRHVSYKNFQATEDSVRLVLQTGEVAEAGTVFGGCGVAPSANDTEVHNKCQWFEESLTLGSESVDLQFFMGVDFMDKYRTATDSFLYVITSVGLLKIFVPPNNTLREGGMASLRYRPVASQFHSAQGFNLGVIGPRTEGMALLDVAARDAVPYCLRLIIDPPREVEEAERSVSSEQLAIDVSKDFQDVSVVKVHTWQVSGNLLSVVPDTWNPENGMIIEGVGTRVRVQVVTRSLTPDGRLRKFHVYMARMFAGDHPEVYKESLAEQGQGDIIMHSSPNVLSTVITYSVAPESFLLSLLPRPNTIPLPSLPMADVEVQYLNPQKTNESMVCSDDHCSPGDYPLTPQAHIDDLHGMVTVMHPVVGNDFGSLTPGDAFSFPIGVTTWTSTDEYHAAMRQAIGLTNPFKDSVWKMPEWKFFGSQNAQNLVTAAHNIENFKGLEGKPRGPATEVITTYIAASVKTSDQMSRHTFKHFELEGHVPSLLSTVVGSHRGLKRFSAPRISLDIDSNHNGSAIMEPSGSVPVEKLISLHNPLTSPLALKFSFFSEHLRDCAVKVWKQRKLQKAGDHAMLDLSSLSMGDVFGWLDTRQIQKQNEPNALMEAVRSCMGDDVGLGLLVEGSTWETAMVSEVVTGSWLAEMLSTALEELEDAERFGIPDQLIENGKAVPETVCPHGTIPNVGKSRFFCISADHLRTQLGDRVNDTLAPLQLGSGMDLTLKILPAPNLPPSTKYHDVLLIHNGLNGIDLVDVFYEAISKPMPLVVEELRTGYDPALPALHLAVDSPSKEELPTIQGLQFPQTSCLHKSVNLPFRNTDSEQVVVTTLSLADGKCGKEGSAGFTLFPCVTGTHRTVAPGEILQIYISFDATHVNSLLWNDSLTLKLTSGHEVAMPISAHIAETAAQHCDHEAAEGLERSLQKTLFLVHLCVVLLVGGFSVLPFMPHDTLQKFRNVLLQQKKPQAAVVRPESLGLEMSKMKEAVDIVEPTVQDQVNENGAKLDEVIQERESDEEHEDIEAEAAEGKECVPTLELSDSPNSSPTSESVQESIESGDSVSASPPQSPSSENSETADSVPSAVEATTATSPISTAHSVSKRNRKKTKPESPKSTATIATSKTVVSDSNKFAKEEKKQQQPRQPKAAAEIKKVSGQVNGVSTVRHRDSETRKGQQTSKQQQQQVQRDHKGSVAKTAPPRDGVRGNKSVTKDRSRKDRDFTAASKPPNRKHASSVATEVTSPVTSAMPAPAPTKSAWVKPLSASSVKPRSAVPSPGATAATHPPETLKGTSKPIASSSRAKGGKGDVKGQTMKSWQSGRPSAGKTRPQPPVGSQGESKNSDVDKQHRQQRGNRTRVHSTAPDARHDAAPPSSSVSPLDTLPSLSLQKAQPLQQRHHLWGSNALQDSYSDSLFGDVNGTGLFPQQQQSSHQHDTLGYQRSSAAPGAERKQLTQQQHTPAPNYSVGNYSDQLHHPPSQFRSHTGVPTHGYGRPHQQQHQRQHQHQQQSYDPYAYLDSGHGRGGGYGDYDAYAGGQRGYRSGYNHQRPAVPPQPAYDAGYGGSQSLFSGSLFNASSREESATSSAASVPSTWQPLFDVASESSGGLTGAPVHSHASSEQRAATSSSEQLASFGAGPRGTAPSAVERPRSPRMDTAGYFTNFSGTSTRFSDSSNKSD
eukprot:Clim_evm31s236 gene=Clim_evmTU31s236